MVFVGRRASRWTDRGLQHLQTEPPVRLLLCRIARGAVFVLFLIMALQNLGVELLPLIAGLDVADSGHASRSRPRRPAAFCSVAATRRHG